MEAIVGDFDWSDLPDELLFEHHFSLERPAHPLEPLRAVFAELTAAQREILLTEAIAWAKQQRPAVTMEGRLPQTSADSLRAGFADRCKRFEE